MQTQSRLRLGAALMLLAVVAFFACAVLILYTNAVTPRMSSPDQAAGFDKAWLKAGMALSAAVFLVGLTLNHTHATRARIARTATYALLIFGAVLMVFPFYWMFSTAFKTMRETNVFPPQWLPSSLSLDNFHESFRKAPFARYFINSVIVTTLSVFATGLTTVLASFAFSRLKFPGRDVLFTLLLSMMMVPFEMLVITNYQTIVSWGLRDSLPALFVPFLASIFYTYILRNFFLSVPDGLYWSARVDGAGNWKYLWKIMVPIARPALVTIMLLNAITSWNSFMWPLMVIESTANRTLPYGLKVFTTEAGTQFNLLMAASTVVILPIILLFLFARKQILRGVARGGLKG